MRHLDRAAVNGDSKTVSRGFKACEKVLLRRAGQTVWIAGVTNSGEDVAQL